MNAYAPATSVVVTPTTFEAASYKLTTTSGRPVSPAPPCTPSPSTSSHTKLPKLAGMYSPASHVGSF